MERKWMKNIRKVVPYVPGEQPKGTDLIKLNTNENPYEPSPNVKRYLECDHKYRLYPDPTADVLLSQLATTYGLSKDQIFVGVGSDDVLAMAFMTFFQSEKPILFPDITYSFYDVWADLFRIPYEKQKVDEEFRLVKEDYYKENGGIIFPNPNAPTGIFEPLEFIEDILKHNQESIVIVDEAYIDFGGQSALPLLKKYENLLVVQTFSKSRSLAGIRIGFAMGNPVLIKALNDVKYSFNSYTMNEASLIIGSEALKDQEYFEKTCNLIIETREEFVAEMKQLGFSMCPSKANFVFATHKEYDATEIFEAAKKEKIYFRHFNGERVKDYLRITIGTKEQMKQVISFFKNYMNKS